MRTIIDGINFTFEKGKFYAMTGPNGSGKTTLAKLIMGINPITAGDILFRGKRYYRTFHHRAGQRQESPTVFSSRRVSRGSPFGISWP